jgi:hypothetical protein
LRRNGGSILIIGSGSLQDVGRCNGGGLDSAVDGHRLAVLDRLVLVVDVGRPRPDFELVALRASGSETRYLDLVAHRDRAHATRTGELTIKTASGIRTTRFTSRIRREVRFIE